MLFANSALTGVLIILGLFPAVALADYPGNQVPPDLPELWAPGFINTGLLTRDVTMTPDGREIYFCQATAGYRQGLILVTRRQDDGWTEPQVAPFSGSADWVDLEPFVSPDGSQLFFYSSRPAAPGDGPDQGSQDIWVVDRAGDSWTEPRNLGAPINSEAPEFFPSVTRDGTLYFCRADPTTRRHALFRSRRGPDGYQQPERLPAAANSGASQFNAYVSPDESRLITPVAGHPENRGGVDYWLALRDGQDRWTGPFNLGPVINDGSPGSWSPYVSPDNAVFFFMSSRTAGPDSPWPESWSGLQARHRAPGSGRSQIYWMKADFLNEVPGGIVPEASATQPRMPVQPDRSSPAWPELHGPYLGQEPPGLEPEIFAPGIVSTGLNERDIVISADGQTVYFGVMDLGLVTVMVTREMPGGWSQPVTAPFHADPDDACFEPALNAAGDVVLFLSNRAAPGQDQGRGWANQNIFTSRLVDGKWSSARALPAPLTSEAAEYFPSLAADGTLYFSRENAEGQPFLWYSEPAGEGWGEPVRLPAAVNVGASCFNAFVDSAERFIIACVAGHPENLGPTDYWIIVRNGKDQWLPAQNLGAPFNGPGLRASSAFLSPDGRFLFFSSGRSTVDLAENLTRQDLHRIHSQPGNGASDIWWVDASILAPFLDKAQ